MLGVEAQSLGCAARSLATVPTTLSWSFIQGGYGLATRQIEWINTEKSVCH
jgi:hypothetical protein